MPIAYGTFNVLHKYVCIGLSGTLGGGPSRQGTIFNNTTSSTGMMSQRGVVYFTDLCEMRAALKEMHHYRIVTNSSSRSGEYHMTSHDITQHHMTSHDRYHYCVSLMINLHWGGHMIFT